MDIYFYLWFPLKKYRKYPSVLIIFLATHIEKCVAFFHFRIHVNSTEENYESMNQSRLHLGGTFWMFVSLRVVSRANCYVVNLYALFCLCSGQGVLLYVYWVISLLMQNSSACSLCFVCFQISRLGKGLSCWCDRHR